MKIGIAKIDQKSFEDHSKMLPNKGLHLDLDFGSILVDFWGQVGASNAPKMESKTGNYETMVTGGSSR